MKKFLTVLVVLTFLVGVAPAFAQIPVASTVEADWDNYFQSTFGKLGNGIANVGLGWTQPIQEFRNNDGERGYIQLTFESLGNGIVRTLAGVGQLLTAAVPTVEWEGNAEMTL